MCGLTNQVDKPIGRPRQGDAEWSALPTRSGTDYMDYELRLGCHWFTHWNPDQLFPMGPAGVLFIVLTSSAPMPLAVAR